MRSTKFYSTKLVSSLVLLLLFMNVFSAFAQDPGPNITKPTTCINHVPGTVGSIYTYTYTGTGASPVWTVRGDIQLLDASNNPVGSLAGTTARIRSTGSLVAGKEGYGKGRLTVTFNQAGCGAQREYVDVYKIFSLATQWPADKDKNTIVGPRCVKPNAPAVYSINPVLSVNQNQQIGIDSYKWVVPAGWGVTYVSGDSSSVTLTAPAVIGSNDTLSVYVGKCNPKPYTIKLFEEVPVPVITPLAACVPTSATTVTLSVQNPNAAYEYDWELPASSNWYFTDGSNGTNRTQATITIDNSTNYVTVLARRKVSSEEPECNFKKSALFKIKRSLPAGSVISGPACVDGSKFNTYTLSGATGNFKWTFTSNAGGTDFGFSVPNPSGASVSFKAGTKGGVLSVVSEDSDCGSPITLNITASPARPLAMTGPACVNANSTGHVYTIDPVPGATSYTWTLSGGITASAPSTGTSITVNVGSTGGNISVTANNGTCPSQPLLRAVGLNPVAPTSITATQSCINRGTADEVVFTVANPVAGQTYEWQVIYPTGVTTGWTVKGTTTNGSTVTATTANSITYVTTGTVGTYRVEARTIRTGCSASAWVSSANVVTARAIALSKSEILDPDTGEKVGDLLIASSVTGATYQWSRTINGTTTVLAGETGSTLNLDSYGGGALATYCVVATINGCTTNSACQQSDYNKTAARVTVGQTSPELLSSQVVVYPNPTSSGEFTLQLPAFKGQAGVVLKNLQGQVVYKTEVSKTKSKLSAGKLVSGVYLLQVSLEGKVVTKKVTVKK